jgi:hypothetical protein
VYTVQHVSGRGLFIKKNYKQNRPQMSSFIICLLCFFPKPNIRHIPPAFSAASIKNSAQSVDNFSNRKCAAYTI